MDHDNNNNNPPHDNQPPHENNQPPTPPHANPAQPIYIQMPEQKQKRSGWRFLWRALFATSILANLFLLLMVIGALAMCAPTATGMVREEVIRTGNMQNKIAIIRLEGMITPETSDDFRKKMDAVRRDNNVKAVIVRTVTPGGAVSSSDQIYHMINQYKADTGKPVVAFMQTIAASGGYYTSVACDRIIAEPTVITGSIGVIMNHFVLKDLLEDKLGVNSVVVKSGPKKDWPSMFNPTSEEQKQYLYDKLVLPSFERFVNLVAKGRSHVLTPEKVKKLSDGSIYSAQEALDNNLIDSVGYLGDAIAQTEQLAGITNAHVVEYKKPYSVLGALTASTKSPLEIDPETIHELTTPKLLYLWDGRN